MKPPPAANSRARYALLVVACWSGWTLGTPVLAWQVFWHFSPIALLGLLGAGFGAPFLGLGLALAGRQRSTAVLFAGALAGPVLVGLWTGVLSPAFLRAARITIERR